MTLRDTIDGGTKCNYCQSRNVQTKKCLLKDGNHPRCKWNPRKQDFCESCRKHLNGLFKYVRRKPRRVKKK